MLAKTLKKHLFKIYFISANENKIMLQKAFILFYVNFILAGPN